MEPAKNLLRMEHKYFDNDLRQENLQLKLRIRELESKLAHIHRITLNDVFVDVKPTQFSVYK